MTNPHAPGKYLVLVFDWVGFPKDKPKEPAWQIQYWGKDNKWSRPQRHWDTGGMENFEVIHWQYLPYCPQYPEIR